MLPLSKQTGNCIAVVLPGFKGILSYFTQPGRNFASEISDRLKVIACLEKPNQIHSEMDNPERFRKLTTMITEELDLGKDDAWICFSAAEEDIKTALETIEERCVLSFEGVPGETRKSLENGNTLFERVLPGADRMYPDTDSAPIPIAEEFIENARKELPVELPARLQQLQEWKIPEDCWTYLLRNNLMPLVEEICKQHQVEGKYVCTLIAHDIKGRIRIKKKPFAFDKLPGLFDFLADKGIRFELLKEIVPIIIEHPKIEYESVLNLLNWQQEKDEELFSMIPYFTKTVLKDCRIDCRKNAVSWIMGKLRPRALGNVDLCEMNKVIEKEISGQE